MATRIQIKRLANPRRAKRRNATKRRKMSIKQIRIFGTKAQKAALKRRRNPRKVSVASNRKRRRNKRRSNPALVVTLGAMNPRRKRRNKPVARTRKNSRRRRVNAAPRRTNRRRHHRQNPAKRNARRRNATRIVVVAPKQNRSRRNASRRPRHHVRHHRRNRRNPMSTELFGAPLFGKNSLELVGGGLIGVAAAKFIPTLIPGALTGGIGSSNIGKTIISGISAVVGGWAGSKISPQFGQGMLFGGMMQTLSIALNAFLPSVYGQISPYASLGDLMNGGFTVPQNPLRLPPPPPPPVALPPAGAQARMNLNGLARAYGSAF